MRKGPGRTVSLVGCLALVAGLASGVLAQNNSFAGTWKLNLEKSKFSPGPAPKSATVSIDQKGDTMSTMLTGVAADGASQHWMYTAGFDGKDNPITGSNPYGDTASRKRINATTIETTMKKAGKVTTVNTLVLSPDGKTLTVTVKGTDPQGRPVNNVQVYDRQ
jgi:hypothetical protein